MDQRKFALLEALKTGALHAGEIRLYRRAKLPGLFDQRSKLTMELADEAVRAGLIEIVRVETIGKSAVEWVRVTKSGLDLLLQSESPARALEELRAVLAVNAEGIPVWLADMQRRLDDLTSRFVAEVEQMKLQIDQLSKRASDAIEQIEQAQTPMPATIGWAQDALDVLEERRQVGHGERCSLRDLFAALQKTHADLTIRGFHQGLKRLQEGGLLKLLPDVTNGDAPGPEYALLDSAALYYYVERIRPESVSDG